ncbi:MAG: autotransporter outer membrane beta-barrel domain-containing protein [Deltaproteobacteria bacterium]|nr:autotransporter outer membrane beta-barrel domain-containing protein [Deltaproteobacteria bacterium]
MVLGQNVNLTPFIEGVWTRVGKRNFTTRFGDRFEVEAIDSLRSRVGGKLSGQLGSAVKGHLTAAWERECLGEAKGRLFKDPIQEIPSLKGDSLYLETGLSVKPVESSWSWELNVFGRVGRQKDLGVSAGLKISF